MEGTFNCARVGRAADAASVTQVLLGPVFINAMYNLFTTSMELLDESGFLKVALLLGL